MSERARPKPRGLWRAALPLALFLLYVPLITMLIASFLEVAPGGGRATPSLRWYREVIADPVLLTSLARSLMVALVSSAASTVLGALASLALFRWRFFAGRGLEVMASASLVLPELVLGLSLLSWFALVGATLSVWTVVLAHVTLTLPFTTLVVTARLRGLDVSIEDAARDLGASESQVLWRIILPLLKPAIASAFALAFLLSFDDFLVTFFTNGAGSDLLPVRLYSMLKTGLSPKVLALSSTMLSLSVAVIFWLARRSTFRELMKKSPS